MEVLQNFDESSRGSVEGSAKGSAKGFARNLRQEEPPVEPLECI